MVSRLNAVFVLATVLGICTAGFADTKAGPIALKEAKDSDFKAPDGSTKIELGAIVKLVAQPYITDFFKSKVITASATIKNTGDKPMFYVFSIAFYDKDKNLLGCVSQSEFNNDGLKPGEETQLGSCMVTLPAEELKKVVSYQATFYESKEKM